VLGALAAALLVAASASADPGAIRSKEAEAQQVLGEIQQIDMDVSRAAEAYNLANLKLVRIEREQRANARMLKLAKASLKGAQRTLQARLVTLYTSGAGSGSAVEVILGAQSLDDLMERIDTAERVSDQDAHVLSQVRTFRSRVQLRKQRLAHAQSEQASVVAAKAAAKREIQGKLAERQRLLSSIRSEITRLKQEEAARQAELERQARARLRAQQSAAAAEPAPAADSGASTDSALSVGAAAETPSASVAPPSRYGGVVGIAMQYLGVPYVWGGASPSGFDCSGFIMYVYSKIGVSLPHNAAAQYGYGTPVSRGELQPGDLVFFNGLGHAGIYIGGNSMIHAPHTGDFVKISSLSGWYSSTYVGARRL
jgi:cell wall-associated NlpC family hydrolase